jgi:spermidine synthase
MQHLWDLGHGWIRALIGGRAVGLLVLTQLLGALVFVAPASQAEEIHKEKSLYRNIIVREGDGRRCLLFSVKRGERSQTCMDLQDPRRLVFAYARMSLGGLLVNPNPARVLVIGLGGGSIPVALAELYPDAHIDVVEIDEAVVRVAKQFFNFSETERLQVAVADARVFIKRAVLRKNHYDLIILDAFTGDYIPEHLMTREFLQETRDLLTDDGVLVANTFSTSVLYDHESVTYFEVFGDFLNFKLPISGNRVVIAARQGLPGDFVLKNQALRLAPQLLPYGVDLLDFPANMRRDQDWDASKRALTDQYSPANLLRDED